MKRALITGITGQDGSYLAELLVSKGYEVHGVIRRSSSFNTGRLSAVYNGETDGPIRLHYGDMLDGESLRKAVYAARPDEVYNLAAQSHVRVSFDQPQYTHDVVAGGTLRLLQSVREWATETGAMPRVYQAGSSEMFGNAPAPQNESTPFQPCSPYAVAKVAAYHFALLYRSYGMYVANGILFNHESERRGETFVTRKITRALARIRHGLQDKLELGNLDAKRDWGYAPDYVEAMWRMLQQPEPSDYVIGTGQSHSVSGFLDRAVIVMNTLGDDAHIYKLCDRVTRNVTRLLRPAEVNDLQADARKARRDLGWTPRVLIGDLVEKMCAHDDHLARIEARTAAWSEQATCQ